MNEYQEPFIYSNRMNREKKQMLFVDFRSSLLQRHAMHIRTVVDFLEYVLFFYSSVDTFDDLERQAKAARASLTKQLCKYDAALFICICICFD